MWANFVATATRGLGGKERPKQKEIAAELGTVNQSTVSRWLAGTVVPDNPADVAHVARTFHYNVLVAFVAAGMLDIDDAGRGLSVAEKIFLEGLGARASATERTSEGQAVTPRASRPPSREPRTQSPRSAPQ